jgi:hypothetical protein
MERHYGWVIVAVGALMGCVGMVLRDNQGEKHRQSG